MTTRPQVLLTGATGFVGRRLEPVLTAAGYHVRCLSRDADAARARRPGLDWVAGDVASEADSERVLAGCDAAFYLVHAMGEHGDFHGAEQREAEGFARAAGRAGVRRLVYLGGVAPTADASEHLQSRLDVGETLRRGPVPTLELRASMIIGHGSLSWTIVRDLAARLPVMVLPRWLRSRTEPVDIDDVVIALMRGLSVPLPESAWYDIPGAEVLSGRQILERTALALGRSRPGMLEVPFLTPRLSSHWVRFVTRARWSVAREIVVGLTHDLLARDDRYWRLVDHPARKSFADAARDALADERREEGRLPGFWGAIERLLATRATLA